MAPDPKSPAARLKYLEQYHYITQHLIGIARLNMTAEQKEQIAGYTRELDILHIRRLRDFGVTDDELARVFNYDPDIVADSRKED